MPPLRTAGITTRIALLAGALAAGTNSIAWADPNHDPIDFGQQGSAAEADRTVEIELGDNYFEPGAVGELVWTFSRAADLEIACNIPGHYQAGMYGGIFFDRQVGSAPFNDMSAPPRATL